MERFKLRKLTQTCSASPAQWEGETTDGRAVYIRYRWGWLEAGVGADLADAISNYVYREQLGPEFDGSISEREMQKALKDIFIFERNKLEMRYDCDDPSSAKAFLNGEDITVKTALVVWTPLECRLHLLDLPLDVENGEARKKVIFIDEIKVNL